MTPYLMQHINFLERRQFSFSYLLMFSILFGCLVVLSSIVSIQKLQARFVQNKISALQSEISQLQEKQRDITAATHALSSLQTMEEGLLQRQKWSATMHEISRQIPSGVWLTSISLALPGTLELQGASWNMRPITIFQDNLDRSMTFKEVVLASSKKEGQSKKTSTQVNFTLKCKLQSL